MARILLLEDDPVLSATLLYLLRLEGYAADVAKNGEKAADLAYKNRYDLYPLNGFELLSALRRAFSGAFTKRGRGGWGSACISLKNSAIGWVF